VVSSVTNDAGRPWRTISCIASRVCPASFSSGQLSANARIGLEPMNAVISIGTPTRCEMSMIGVMSAATVRAAQLGRMSSFSSTIIRSSRSTSSWARLPAPGRPRLTTCRPSRSISRTSSIFCSMLGSRTEGDWMPSRMVSSTKRGFLRKSGPRRSFSFQS
jgi:hypothetical protein